MPVLPSVLTTSAPMRAAVRAATAVSTVASGAIVVTPLPFERRIAATLMAGSRDGCALRTIRLSGSDRHGRCVALATGHRSCRRASPLHPGGRASIFPICRREERREGDEWVGTV